MKPIIAILHGNTAAQCGRIMVDSSSPVTALCRALVDEGHDPDTPLECWRRDKVALTVRSIGTGAALFAVEGANAPRFTKWRKTPPIKPPASVFLGAPQTMN